mmetsp:Transcript_16881/g.32960  ORF Transcript_16881/g.32960 Transcript_16881/m.32960 type:complete len:911 (-) Transcript_16881:240-2972(-)|eukprot:CAMPEP_0175143900 /NCGR_PEP_ID=MMETSP0087-20121206/13776_1 /TAXON_ID=136419 /ORGANISM="Unknown Unknown, Strain D1" /LENGTH=910 /DNA_ID=CAMNT_0016428195 /DNA_START=37 /DNA_END=2769 /DNA_ORIENTATION=+
MATQRRVNGYGVVKTVLSGDSLVLMGAPAQRGGIPPERTVVFTGINAPRFTRSKNASDEPYAWEAREFIRKKCIGQQVSFNVGHSAGERDYGNVFVGDENLGHSLVKAGLGRVKEAPEGAKVSVEREQLQNMEAEAKAAGLGLWSKSPEADHVRNIDWQPSATKLFDRFKGKPINCVVSQLRNGSALRCEVPGNLGGKSTGRPFMIVTLSLAGAACPRVPFNNASAEEEPEPFSMEANHWVEARLLNREVQIVIQGIDKTENVYGDVVFPKGNVTSKLLELGLAKFVPWTAQMSPHANDYAAAAKTAQIAKRGLGGQATDEPEPAEMFGKVVFVQSGDTLVFVNDADGAETKFSLASIMCARPPRRGEPADERASGFAFEAKEFLRSRLIGKKDKVRAVVEFKRTLPNGEERAYGTLFIKEINLAVALCQAGLAEVVRHGYADPHSLCYGKLIEAERAAVNSSAGMHNKSKGSGAIVDLTDRPRKGSENEEIKMAALAAKGSAYLLNLKNEKHGVPAVVEYCFSGSRFKLFIPKERILVSFVLSGVRTPNTRDPFGPEALEFSRSRILQRNVRVEIESVDRGCNFIGNLFAGSTNLGTELTVEGFASVFPPSADRSPYCDEFYNAEAKAQEAKLNIWKNYVEKVSENKDGEEDEVSKRVDGSQLDVKVTEITDASSFYIQRVDDSNIAKVDAAMAAFNASPPEPNPAAEWKKGTVVAGKFHDDLWYRVRLEGITATKEWRVLFVDYGNADLLNADDLRSLPDDLAKIPPLSKACFLAGIRGPTKASEHFESAAMTFNELALERVLSAKVECIDKSNKWHLTLRPKAEDVEDGDTTSINQILLREGWCRIVERPEFKLKGLVNELRKDEDSAKQSRFNIWEYGDVSDEEEEEEAGKGRVRFDGRTGKPRNA